MVLGCNEDYWIRHCLLYVWPPVVVIAIAHTSATSTLTGSTCCISVGRTLCLVSRVLWVPVPPRGAHFFVLVLV